MYFTHLTRWFQSSSSVRNYVLWIRVFHRELGLPPSALDSFKVQCLVRVADISMRTPSPLRSLPILPDLLHCLCLLTPSLGPLSPSMWLWLTFVFFAMLMQSNVAPPSHSAFGPSSHTCRGVIFLAPRVAYFRSGGPKHIRRSTKTWCCQFEVWDHPADTVAAYHLLPP